MGLCKCPHRRVTNIFCYEHRVNCCEHCLMQNHPKCVVDTYRNWITDSVFSPKCSLCSEDLDSGETVRLLCFHIVHWECLDSWARSLPPTTAPAGYTCPVCNRMCLFPALNQVSPIADALRAKMAEVNWSRAGLGLPLMDNDIGNNALNSSTLTNGTAVSEETAHQNNFSNLGGSSTTFDGNLDMTKVDNLGSPYQNSSHASSFTPGTHGATSLKNSMGMNSSNHVEPSTSYMSSHKGSYTSPPLSKSFYGDISTDSSSNTNSRKPVSKFDYEMPLLFDEDEHKYRRKSPFEALSRWLKNANPASHRRKTRKRTIIYAIVTIVVLVVMFMILFGRNEDYDEGFDPKLNPNVFIGEREAVGKGHEDS